MSENLVQDGKFTYYESDDSGTPVVLLHGLMGTLSNFGELIEYFKGKHKVVLPILPFFDIPLRKLSVSAMVEYVNEFIDYKGYPQVFVLGNSLGGHIAQLYALERPERVKGMVLTGSSGLFENAMGNSFPKRGDYNYIKKKAEDVFYDPAVATKELVDEVYSTVNDLKKAMCIVALAKSAIRHNLEDKLQDIKNPSLLVWGIQDSVTPLWVGEKFHDFLPNSTLVKIDKTGHAPMMERPGIFNKVLEEFIESVESGNFYTTLKDRVTTFE